jgi:uncharacterized membrane protein
MSQSTPSGANLLQRWFSYFLMSAIVGYVYEFLLLTFVYDGFVNQGPLRGPWLMIYGVGGVLIIAILGRLRGKKLKLGPVNVMPVVVFVAIYLISTTLEFFAHWGIESAYGIRMWDYSCKFLNIDGRVCFEDSLRFAILGMVGIYLIVPLLDKLLAKLSRTANWILFGVLLAVFCADIAWAVIEPYDAPPPKIDNSCRETSATTLGIIEIGCPD